MAGSIRFVQNSNFSRHGGNELEIGILLGILGLFFSVVAIVYAVLSADHKQVANFWRRVIWPISWLYPKSTTADTIDPEIFRKFRTRPGMNFFRSPLPIERLTSSFEDVWTMRPSAIETIAQGEIEAAQKRAEASGRTLDPNGSFELRRIDVSRPEGEGGKRLNQYHLQFRPTDFHSFVFPNLRIFELSRDDEVASNQLREASDLVERDLTFDSLEKQRARFRVGVNTIAITSDGYVVLSVRSKRQLMACGADIPGFASREKTNPSLRLHTSAPEGMYRSEADFSKSDLLDGLPHPAATAIRALEDELGLQVATDYAVNQMKCLGWYLDLLRSEPQFVFFIKLRASKQRVFDAWAEGPIDKHENLSICCAPWDLEAIAEVYRNGAISELGGEFPEIDEPLFSDLPNIVAEWSSNHAKTSTMYALAHSFGARQVHKLLSGVVRSVPQDITN